MEHTLTSYSTILHNIPKFVQFNPLSTEQLAALSTFQSFIAGLNKLSPEAMKSVILPLGAFAKQRETAPQITHLTLDQAVDVAIAKASAGSRVEETIEDDGLEVKVDGSLGMIWAKYRILIDGKEIMEGRNVISLVKIEERGWVISGIADTGRAVVGNDK